jgi:hypothetical protein
VNLSQGRYCKTSPYRAEWHVTPATGLASRLTDASINQATHRKGEKKKGAVAHHRLPNVATEPELNMIEVDVAARGRRKSSE